MAKALNSNTVSVNMQFTADTESAKKQIQNLQQQLTNLMKSGSNADTLGINGEISDAISKCASLKAALESATDVKTGNLDLGVFNKSLQKSKTEISDYAKALSALGPEGEQAFATLAQSIVTAEVPMKKTNALLQEFKTTLANTARWQISSSILHGFMGSLQSAFYYAEDLNESLNNIRIVTGQNTDQMAKFAKQANAAAQALSTTTTDYTNASLIYYQQGLSDDEVVERTNTTVKMANVAGETAETVSDQMTAIWNNFYDGSKSIEYYADVLAKLGATTASSSAEISEGVEKFASVANTVGLSYEYAASAIATVTAETRQSADVVGTAFKTMFARIQDLEQGETLDDGTTLGTYAQALEKVGISIKDQEGNLKDMDEILEEMGAKWQTIAKDQQVALAENLAGTRQYTQLISLMDNWDKFQENLTTAYGSEGTLQKQAEIYEESWEAALNRVQAAAEDIYSKLIDDKFIIKVLDFITKIINGIDDMIDGLGGLKGILAVAGNLLINAFGDNIVKNIQRISDNFKLESDSIDTLRKDAADAVSGMYTDSTNSISGAARADVYQKQSDLQNNILEVTKQLQAQNIELTEEEKKQLQYLLDANDALGKQYIQIAKNREESEKTSQTSEAQAKNMVREAKKNQIESNFKGASRDYINRQSYNYSQEFTKALGVAKESARATSVGGNLSDRFFAAAQTLKTDKSGQAINSKEFDKLKESITGTVEAMKEVDPSTFKKLESSISNCANAEDLPSLKKAISGLSDATADLAGKTDDLFGYIQTTYGKGMDKSQLEDFSTLLNDARNSMDTTGRLTVDQIQAFKDYGIQVDATGKIIDKFGNQQKDLASTLVTAAQGISAIITALTTLSGIVDTVADTSTSFGEKVVSIVSALAVTLPILISGMKSLATAFGVTNVATQTLTLSLGSLKLAVPELTAIVLVITAIAAGIAIVVGYFKQLDQAEEDARQEQIKLAQTAKDLADTQKDLEDTVQDLIDKYNELASIGGDTSEVFDELQEKIPELIDSYEDLADALDIDISEQISQLQAYATLAGLTGDYSQFETASSNLSSQLQTANFNAQKTAATSSAASLAYSLKTNGKNSSVIGNQLSFNVSGSQLFGNEETDSNAILRKYLSSYIDNSNVLDPNTETNFKIDTSDQQSVIDFYENLQKARDEMLDTMTTAEIASSGTYKAVNELLTNTSDAYETAVEEMDAYVETAGNALTDALGDGSDIKTMQEFLAYRDEFLKIGTSDAYGLTEEQTEALLEQSEALSDVGLQYKLLTSIMEKYGETLSDEDIAGLSGSLSDLSTEQLQIAVALVPTATSMEDFQQQFEESCMQALTNAYTNSADTIQSILADAASNNKFSTDDWSKLEEDDQFIEYLDSVGKTFDSIKYKVDSTGKVVQTTFAEQYAVVSEYYSNVRLLQNESYADQISYYKSEIDEKRQQLDSIKDLEESKDSEFLQARQDYADAQLAITNAETDEEKEQAEQLAATLAEKFSQKYGFEIDLSNASAVESEIDRLKKKIEELEDKQIEIAVSWDDIDSLEAGLKQVASFAQMIQDDTKQVGNSYQLTAAQAREWMEVYPELFATAKTTTSGIIELDKSAVDAYIDGQDQELDASFDTAIQTLQLQKEELQAELDAKEAELKANGEFAEGNLAIEDASADYIQDLHDALTEYLIDLGVDTSEANADALEMMGLDQETYSDLVADASEKNAENQEQASKDGGNAQASVLSQLTAKYGKFVGALATVAKAVKAALSGESISDVWHEYISPTVTTNSSSYEGIDTSDYQFNGTDGTTITASMRDVTNNLDDTIKARMAELQTSIDSIDSEIAYIQALRDQDLADYGKTSTDSSSGSSKSLSTEDLKEIEDRYHDINSEISLQEKLLSRASKAADKAYGGKKIEALKEQRKALKVLIEDEQKLLDLETGYLAIDKAAVKETFSNAQFDDDTQRLLNYSELERQITNTYNEAIEKYNNSSQDDAAKSAKEQAEKTYEKQKKLLDQYESTFDAYQESIDTIQEKIDEDQQAAYDIIDYEMELREDLLEREAKLVDSQISILGDSFYKMAEVGALYSNNYIDNYNSQYENAKSFAEAAKESFEAGDITQAKYIEALQTSQDMILSTIKDILDLDSTMSSYYSNTIKAGQEELSTYTGQMQNLNKVLEHYQNLLKLTGRQYDYKTIGAILESSLTNTKNLYEIAKANYEDLQERADRLKEQLERNDLGEKEREMLQSEYSQLVSYAEEAQETMYGYLEDIGNTAAEIYSNNLSKIRKEFESTLSDAYSSFDDLNTKIDRLSSSQSDYLTKTNQLYETNKLIRQATEDMNTTENKQAKQRYNDYIQYIQKLQDSEQLSNAKLKIAQAEYEVLQAQMALEDAQNSKSTVRMTKDSEGNWGYVYTADQSNINDKQQAYEDAVNNLYNIGVEGAQDASSQMAQIVQEMYDDLEDIANKRREGYYASDEEYYAALEASRKYYFGKLEAIEQDYSDYEQVIQDTSSQGIIDYSTLTVGKVSDIEKAYDDAAASIEDNQNELDSNTAEITESIGSNYTETKKKVDDVTTASENLSDYVENTLLGTIQDEYDAVEELSLAWAANRDSIYAALEAMQEYAEYEQSLMSQQSYVSSGDYSVDMVNAILNDDLTTLEAASAARVASTGGVYNGIYNDEQIRALGYEAKKEGYTSVEELFDKYGVDLFMDYAKAAGKSYDSGGYTGSWGPEGKLATLHENELILNKNDSSTFIDTTNRLASISKLLDVLASASSGGLGDLFSALGTGDTDSTLQQEVHIEANFPNATNKSEITEAFENIINLASQYANRKV